MDLLRRFALGDIDAFETLVQQFQGDIYAWIVRIVRDPGIAEDLTVETLWRIYRAHLVFPQIGGGLHLYQTPAVFPAAQDVSPDNHALIVECSLEDCWDFGICDKLLRDPNSLFQARAIDLDTTGEQSPRKQPDFTPLLHNRFVGSVRLSCHFGLMDLPIKPLEALAARSWHHRSDHTAVRRVDGEAEAESRIRSRSCHRNVAELTKPVRCP